MPKTVRLQVDVLEHQLTDLKRMQGLGGLRSIRELWDTAFTAFKWLARKKAQGMSIGCMSDDGVFTELEMPFFEDYAVGVNRERADSQGERQLASQPHEEGDVAAYAAVTPRRNGASSIGLAKRKQPA